MQDDSRTQRSGMQEERVAVGSGVGDYGGADGAAAARPVLDNDGLPDPPRYLVEHNACNDLVGRACAEWADHLDCAGRPWLCRGCRCASGDPNACDPAMTEPYQPTLLSFRILLRLKIIGVTRIAGTAQLRHECPELIHAFCPTGLKGDL